LSEMGEDEWFEREWQRHRDRAGQWFCPGCGSVAIPSDNNAGSERPDPCDLSPDCGDTWVEFGSPEDEVYVRCEAEERRKEGEEHRRERRRAFVRASDVKQRRIGFLWHPHVPRGVVTGFGGDGGVGKSTVTCSWAAAVTRGFEMPNGWRPMNGEAANVLMMNAEDDLEAVLAPRLAAAGADLDRVKLLDLRKDDGLAVLSPGTLRTMDDEMEQLKPRLVVIDPIVSFVGEARDMNRANEIRPMIRALQFLAARHDCGLVVVGHLNKNESARPGNRFSGTVDFRNAFRSLLLAGRVDGEPERGCAVFHNKSNYAYEAEPVGYVTATAEGDHVAHCEWGPTDLTEREVFDGKAPQTGKAKTGADVVREVLKGMPNLTAPGAMMHNVIEAALGTLPSPGTMQKIRDGVPVVTAKHGDGTTDWTLRF
jgi:AAA domain